MNRLIILAAAPLVLAGCATAQNPPADPVPVNPGGQCDADGAQSLLGSRATSETGAQLLAKSGARTLRWVPPRTAVTMDFRPDRLTVSYDDTMTITRISCG